MTATYRAIEQYRFAGSFAEATRVVDLPITAPGPDDIRVRNIWCGINGIFDTQLARNAVPYLPLTLPLFCGVEAVGVVEEVGEAVRHFAPGDAVASTRFGNGYREMITAPAGSFAAVPTADAECLALASSGVAAWLGLTHTGQLKSGEVLAVSAAAGGLGHLDVQIGKALGAHVIAICGGAKKAALVRELGADRVIDYRTEDVGEVLARDYKDRIDVAIDTVGGDIFDAFVANLAPHGRCVISGAASELETDPPLVTRPRIGHSLYYKGASVRSFMNGLLTDQWPAARHEVLALYHAGKLRPVLDHHGLSGVEAIPALVDRLQSGVTMGKVALRF